MESGLKMLPVTLTTEQGLLQTLSASAWLLEKSDAVGKLARPGKKELKLTRKSIDRGIHVRSNFRRYNWSALRV